jgi:hypothetical protein
MGALLSKDSGRQRRTPDHNNCRSLSDPMHILIKAQCTIIFNPACLEPDQNNVRIPDQQIN